MLAGFVCQELAELQFVRRGSLYGVAVCAELKATQTGAGFLMRKL